MARGPSTTAPGKAPPVRHLAQAGGVHGGLHLGVHRFHGSQAGGLGGLDAQGPGHVDGVAEDIRLFRQGGGDVQAAVGADEQPVQAGELQNDQVAGQAADVQAPGPVQGMLEQGAGGHGALHEDLVFAAADGLDDGVDGLGRIPDVRQLHRSGVQLHLLQQGQHALHVAEKLGGGQAGGQGVLHGQQGVLVIGGGHGDALAAVGQGCLQQLVKIADLFHSGSFLSYM